MFYFVYTYVKKADKTCKVMKERVIILVNFLYKRYRCKCYLETGLVRFSSGQIVSQSTVDYSIPKHSIVSTATCSGQISLICCHGVLNRLSLTFYQKISEERGAYTDKKENKIFLIYKEIQSGAVAKSYIRKGFLIYEEMRKYFPIYEEAVSHI